MATDGIVLQSWESLVDNGYNEIKKQYPQATLLRIISRPKESETARDAVDLVRVGVICTVAGTEKARVDSFPGNRGEYGPISVFQDAPIEDGTVDWPPFLFMSEAIDIIRKAGHTQGISEVTLSQPIEEIGLRQAFYTFHVGGQLVKVGTKDKQIQA